MKIRNCFVSNSSTSSFVLLGYEVSKEFTDKDFIEKICKLETEDLWEAEEESGLSFLSGREDGISSNKNVIGIKIATAYSDDYDSFESETLISDIEEKLAIVKPYASSEIKVFTGVEVC
jgi:hypothetical protein